MRQAPPHRVLFLALAIAAATALSGCDSGNGPSATAPASLGKLKADAQPKPVPGVAFEDGSGKPHRLSDFRGRYVLLNLWATWCAPCVRELPALAKLQKAMGTQKLSVVPVDVGRDSAAEIAKFLTSHKISLPVYRDANSAFLGVFGAAGLPLSVLIDPQGREIARALGAVKWDAPETIAYFKSLGKSR